MTYSLKYLQGKPTLETDQTKDLKVLLPRRRAWLVRGTDQVIVERFFNGQWREWEEYQAPLDEPEEKCQLCGKSFPLTALKKLGVGCGMLVVCDPCGQKELARLSEEE